MSKDKYGFEQNPIQIKINTAIHKFWMFYYGIRNYRKLLSHKRNNWWKYWELTKPLKIQYQVRTKGYFCKECDALGRDKTDHLEYIRNFERYIWSKKINYTETNCCCEDLLFEPLDEYYSSGGDDGSGLCAGANSQWTIVERGVHYEH